VANNKEEVSNLRKDISQLAAGVHEINGFIKTMKAEKDLLDDTEFNNMDQ